MSVARVTEISSVSEKSFEDAVEQGIARASETLHGIRGAWVKEQEVEVDDGKIVGYKVIMKLTFVLDAERGRSAGAR
ncbi:MAG: dodecin domain-containing protein [Acidobacteria bacterium]|nr:MAG: dodecin domain-containing protein [Acidobacteriota bacterium]